MGKRERKAKEKGLVSVFLAGVLTLTSVTIGALHDVQMLSLAKAEMRSGLRLSSHMMLSRFSKSMAKEFGLFAVENFDQAKSEAEGAVEERINPGFGRQDMLAMELETVEIEAKEGERLSRPEVMEGQIVQFMEWQMPRLALSSVLLNFDFYQQMQKALPVIQARVNYEEMMQGVQEKLDKLGGEIEGLVDLKFGDLFPGGGKYDQKDTFAMLPPLSAFAEPIFDGCSRLSAEIRASQARLSRMDPESPDYEEAKRAAKREMGRQLKEMQSYHHKVSQQLIQIDSRAGKINQAIQTAKGKVSGLDTASETWRSQLDQLPAGELAATMWGDYYAQTGLTHMGALLELEEEMDKVQSQARKMKESWDRMEWGGSKFSQLRADQLSSSSGRPRVDLVAGMKVKEEVQDTEKLLNLSRESKRSTFKEFIQAWVTKRKLIKNTRKANRAGQPGLKGSIRDYIDGEAMNRFSADYAGWQDVNPMGKISLSNERSILKGSLQQLEEAGNKMTAPNLVDQTVSASQVMCYWAGMFSCRTLPLKEADGEKDYLSLTGLLLHDRALFGGEQEFILWGQDQFMKNLEETARVIFALRLLSNLVYAFSSPELHTETSSLTLALAGWTGFAVPLVQSALLATLACGESYVDLQQLLDGEDLPVYKDRSSWHFSLSGIQPLTEDLVSNIFDVIDDEVLSGSQALSSVLKDRCQSMGDAAKEAIIFGFKAPLARFMMDAVLAVTEKEEEMKLEERYQQMIASLKSRQSDSLPGQAAKAILSEMDSYQGAVLNKIHEMIQARKDSDGQTAGTAEEIEAFVDALIDPVTGRVNEAVDAVESKWERKAGELRGVAEDQVNQAAAEWLNQFQKELSGSEESVFSAGKGAGINMGYDDYVKLLLAMKASSTSSRWSGLSNTGKLIQAQTDSIDLTLAPTQAIWEAQLKVSTPFLKALDITSFAEAKQGSIAVKENWEEGYGMAKKNE